MRRVRLHVSLFDEPATSKQRTIAFLEVEAELPDSDTLDEYLGRLSARAIVTDEERETRSQVTLAPGAPE